MPSDATLPLGRIAKLLLLSDRRVQQLTKDGVIPRAERGRYDLETAVHGYIKYLRDRAIGADASGGDEDHKKRLVKARADIAEMEAERIAGLLIEVSKVEKTWLEIMSRVKSKLLNIAPKASPIVAVETTTDSCHKIISKFVNEALTELSSTEIEENGDIESRASIAEDGDEGDEDLESSSNNDGDGVVRSKSETV